MSVGFVGKGRSKRRGDAEPMIWKITNFIIKFRLI